MEIKSLLPFSILNQELTEWLFPNLNQVLPHHLLYVPKSEDLLQYPAVISHTLGNSLCRLWTYGSKVTINKLKNPYE